MAESATSLDLHDPPWRARVTLPVLVAVAALVAIVSSLGAPLIPSIARSDRVSLSTGEWVLTAALLAGALATPAMGRLADGTRKRMVIVFALVAVFAGCVLSAVSTGFAVLALGRGLQGVGLGLLPVTMAIARSQFTPDKTARAVATLSVSAAVGAGLGYPITSLIAQFYDYRGAFWFGAITVALALLLVVIVLPLIPMAALEGSTTSAWPLWVPRWSECQWCSVREASGAGPPPGPSV